MLGFHPLSLQLQTIAQIKSLFFFAWPMTLNSLGNKKILVDFKWKHDHPSERENRIDKWQMEKKKRHCGPGFPPQLTSWFSHKPGSTAIQWRRKNQIRFSDCLSSSCGPTDGLICTCWQGLLIWTHRHTRAYMCMVSRNQVCGTLLQYPKLSNTDTKKKVGWYWNWYLNSLQKWNMYSCIDFFKWKFKENSSLLFALSILLTEIQEVNTFTGDEDVGRALLKTNHENPVFVIQRYKA